MLITGDNQGNIKSLKFVMKNENCKFILKNLTEANGHRINQINSFKKNEIFFGSVDGMISVFDKKSNKSISNRNFSDTELNTYHVFENGNILAFYNNYMRTWKKKNDLYFFSKNKIIIGKNFKYVLANQSEKFILTASFFENQIYLWSIFENKLVLGGKNELKEFIVSLKGASEDLFTIGTHSGSVYIYSIYGELIRSIKKNYFSKNFKRPDLQKSAAWLGKNIIFSGKLSGRIEIVDLRCHKSASFLSGHSSEVSNISISSSTESFPFLASSDALGNLKIWDIRGKEEIFFQKKFTSKITSLSFL